MANHRSMYVRVSTISLLTILFAFAISFTNHATACAEDVEPAPWEHIISVIAGNGFTVGLRDDGRVAFAGDNFSKDIWKIAEWRDIKRVETFDVGYLSYIVGYENDGGIRLTSIRGQYYETHFHGTRWFEEDISDWEHIEQLVLGNYLCAGLRTDGTVVATGDYLSEEDIINISEWRDVVKIVYNTDEPYYGFYGGLIGLKSDGTVECTNWAGLAAEWGLDEEWSEIADIQFGIVPDSHIKLYGIKKDGTLIGLSRGEVKYGDGWPPHFFAPEECEWKDVINLYYTADFLYALRSDGRVCLYTFEDLNDMDYNYSSFSPFEVTMWTDVVQFDCELWRSGVPAGLRKDGTVITLSSSWTGRDTSDWTDVKKIIGFDTILLGIRENGDILVTGNHDDETENQIIQEAQNWTNITDISVTSDEYYAWHVAALKNDGTVLTAGDNSKGQCELVYPVLKENENFRKSDETRSDIDSRKESTGKQQTVVTSGTCGPNLTWNLDENGQLMISGDGYMEHYNLPWYPLRYQIQSVVVEGADNIGSGAFYDCKKLSKVTLSDSIKIIESGAFMECVNLREISFPAGLEEIQDSAFRHCIGLKELYFPETLKTIGGAAFQACEKIKKVIVAGNTEFEYHGYTFDDHPTGSDEYCDIFEGCNNLRSAGPIGSGCNFEFAWKDHIDVFTNWRNLSEVILPDTVTAIPDHAFYGCRSLESIRIPDGVTAIGSGAFARCDNLKDINLPDGVTSIGNYAFYGCFELKEIQIPEATEEIGEGAFLGCRNLEKVIMPERLENRLGGKVFCGCASLSEIVIPEGVMSIHEFSFRDCENLESVTLPQSLEEIARTAFMDCPNLQRVYCSENAEWENYYDNLSVTDYAEERCGYFDAAERIVKE